MCNVDHRKRARPRVLHIATWYPSEAQPHIVPFIKSHYEALQGLVDQRLVHVEVSEGDRVDFRTSFGPSDKSYCVIRGYRGPTRLREVLTLLLLILVRYRLGRRHWDVVVVHVAWPTLRFPKIFKFLYGNKIVLIEHWSAYAHEFYLDPKSAAHARMRKILAIDSVVVAVSKRLAKDIFSFVQREDLDIRVVPNVVDAGFYLGESNKNYTIFMAATWNEFRLPFLVLNAVVDLISVCPKLQIIIAGSGAQMEKMRDFVINQPWGTRVFFLGSVGRHRIITEMRRATLFAHPTKYETFSVITAEALSCGVPAVVSNVGALPEVIKQGENGFLVENNEKAWRNALLAALEISENWDRQKISENAKARFSSHVVGRQLAEILTEVVEG